MPRPATAPKPDHHGTPSLSPPQVPSSAPPASHAPLDPTRYGDWEKNGRCIDF
ncbi:hypothetical protein B1806_14220 [Metallibacterium scheffleri]|uniref:DUF1674 domain-containing protein n=1 Tax=Metallibacterium scheffleri TaxID=993689 RepID=A0A4S3KH67_9GAMM|nr:hypothetical protein B1806_14220 [Metallibacterium scheffleri]